MNGAPYANRHRAHGAQFGFIRSVLRMVSATFLSASLVPEALPTAPAGASRPGVGGFIISNGSAPELAAKTNALQAQARVPLLMVSDLESGPGMRLRGGGTDFPPVMGLAATGSDSLAFAVGKVIGEEGRAVGLHLTLSPVLDVNSNPRNPIINTTCSHILPHPRHP